MKKNLDEVSFSTTFKYFVYTIKAIFLIDCKFVCFKLFFITENIDKPDANATIYDGDDLKFSMKVDDDNKNNKFYLKLVDSNGNEQIKQFTVAGDDTFDYYWQDLRKGESFTVVIKEVDGLIESPWYFIDQVDTGLYKHLTN